MNIPYICIYGIFIFFQSTEILKIHIQTSYSNSFIRIVHMIFEDPLKLLFNQYFTTSFSFNIQKINACFQVIKYFLHSSFIYMLQMTTGNVKHIN